MTQPTEQPASGHIINVTAEDDTIRLHIDCHEPAGAFCRTSPDGKPGGCYAVEWFDLCMLTELHDPDVGPESLSDGMPVVVSWNGDVESWVWRTDVPAAAERVA